MNNLATKPVKCSSFLWPSASLPVLRSLLWLIGVTKKPSTSPLLLVLQKCSGKLPNKMHTLNMQELGLPNQRRHQQQSQHQFLCSPMSMRTLEQWAFFTLVVLPLYITVQWCLLSRPIRTSLLQFSMATMVWSAHPIKSITLLHNENMATSYADGRTLTLQLILPAVAANTLRHPRHLLTMLRLSKESDLSKHPPDMSICARSNITRIQLRVQAPCCQLGQTQKCHPTPLNPLW